VILPSTQQVLDIAARLCLNAGDMVWMEDPGYRGARAILVAAGAKVVPVPVDAHGLDVEVGVRLASRARLAYVTPGRQTPLGVTMSIERRVALLRWAQEGRALVIEDDYDSEYRYEGRPVPALQGLDRAGVVLHTGTFSKTLLPSLRLAYAVVPDSMLEAFVAAKSILDRFTPPLLQERSPTLSRAATSDGTSVKCVRSTPSGEARCSQRSQRSWGARSP
jgi:GntR family transcriptional regulator/MocR family aminotransferase